MGQAFEQQQSTTKHIEEKDQNVIELARKDVLRLIERLCPLSDRQSRWEAELDRVGAVAGKDELMAILLSAPDPASEAALHLCQHLKSQEHSWAAAGE